MLKLVAIGGICNRLFYVYQNSTSSRRKGLRVVCFCFSRATDNGKWLNLLTCPTVQMIYISTLLTFLSSGPGLTSYCKLSMTLLAFLAVEVVHVGTQFTLICKGRLNPMADSC